VVEDASGRILYIDDGGVTRYSTDEGDSWNAYPAPTLPSSAGVPTIDGTGRLVIVLAPLAVPSDTMGQPPMTYTSTDDGATWSLLTPQIPNANVFGYAVDKRGRLLAATGGGLYRLDGSAGGP